MPDLLRHARQLLDRRRGTFSHVVPLGLSCRVTYQVRLYFGSATAYPFDWWLSPLDGLTRYLADPHPDRIYAPEALAEKVVDGWVKTIVAPEFGFELFHEFPRRKEAPPMRVVAPDWREHIAVARSRHVHLLERLLSLDRRGNRILFVRHRSGVESVDPDARQAVERLWQTLLTLWPSADIHLLLVNLPPFELPDERILRVDFDDPPGPPPEAWRGDPERWSASFASAGIAAPPRRTPAERAPGPPD